MTRLRTPGGREVPADARAVAVACLGVLLLAATAVSAPRSVGMPLHPAPAPTSSPADAASGPAEVRHAWRHEAATPSYRPGAAQAGVVAEESESVNINRADASVLQRLPGLGPALAERIVRHRETHGAFRTPEDLLDVPGIGAKRYARLHRLVRTADAP